MYSVSVALHELTWDGAWLYGVHRTRRDCSSFTWHHVQRRGTWYSFSRDNKQSYFIVPFTDHTRIHTVASTFRHYSGKNFKANRLGNAEFEQRHTGNNSPYKMPLLTCSACHTRKPSRTGLVSCIPYGIRSLASGVTSREIDLGPSLCTCNQALWLAVGVIPCAEGTKDRKSIERHLTQMDRVVDIFTDILKI